MFFMASYSAKAVTTQVTINDDWRFSLGDTPAAKDMEYDADLWQELTLPHDWAFEGGFSEDGAQRENGGYAMGGIGWYRKVLNIKEEQITNGRDLYIDFEGVYMNSEVWINGHYLGKRPYGYISFSYLLTEYLHAGENILAVRVDNSLEPSARWYHGCGIYSNVHLRSVDRCYFESDGTYITTPNMESVAIASEVVSKVDQRAKLTLSIFDDKGKKVTRRIMRSVDLKKGINNLEISAEVKSAELWSPESPNLYYAELEICNNRGELLDTQQSRFGFRSVAWDTDKGLILNGEICKLRGVCEHMEGGPIGAINSEVVLRWRLQQLKDMGCNAVRTAHNPYCPIFYDICDEMGLLVMDEIFDGWSRKADHDYGAQAFDEWWERDLRSWLRRDRNHPSIFLWSLGNETHGDVAKSLVAVCQEIDPTRLVTSGDSNANDMMVYGVNGRSEKRSFVEFWEKSEMDKPMIATENPHTWQVRGFYRSKTWYRNGYPSEKFEPFYIPDFTENEIFAYDWISPAERRNKKQIFNSSYDNATVRVTARHLIEMLRDVNWLSGSFRWTGYDYVGEAGYVHGGWPFRAFQSGALDLAGFPKDLYYLYQSEWTERDMVHILPHWTHPVMKIGEQIPVVVYTTGDSVELFLNGRSMGRKSKGRSWDKMQIEWLVPFEEGVVEAVAYRDGYEIARASQRSSGAPADFEVAKYDDRELEADGADVAILSVAQQDQNGTLYPYGENRLYAKIYGAARVLSFESGSPVDTECNFGADSREFFFGLNRLFVQSVAQEQVEDVSIILATISGDKKLMLSNRININVEEVALRGKLKPREFEIRYTTDGSRPTRQSALYDGDFEIELGTTVRAELFVDGEVILSMQEEFSENSGLYWGTAGEEVCNFDGEQAEVAMLSNANIRKIGDGFYGDSYVTFKGKGGAITWYQENDGGAFDAEIIIRYSQKLESGESCRMELYNDSERLGIVEFKDTGSEASHWREVTARFTMKSGGNNIKLVALDENTPSIDQAKFE
ncbi:MAG: glycoside hydrolase family 2 TIM barrel-domain containing protein [Rikenellaceae bacterium]